MTVSDQQLTDILQNNGYSVTQVRRRIFHALQGSEPMTMAELAALLENKLDRASLYRCLALYEKLGIVQRIQIGWKYRIELSNDFQPHHHHIRCTRCGLLAPLMEDIALERQLTTIALSQGFEMSDHQVEIIGICPRCKVAP